MASGLPNDEPSRDEFRAQSNTEFKLSHRLTVRLVCSAPHPHAQHRPCLVRLMLLLTVVMLTAITLANLGTHATFAASIYTYTVHPAPKLICGGNDHLDDATRVLIHNQQHKLQPFMD